MSSEWCTITLKLQLPGEKRGLADGGFPNEVRQTDAPITAARMTAAAARSSTCCFADAMGASFTRAAAQRRPAASTFATAGAQVATPSGYVRAKAAGSAENAKFETAKS